MNKDIAIFVNSFRSTVSVFFWSIALSLGFCEYTFTQIHELRYELLSVEQGLSQTSVWSILQDHEGFLWFGTADGLNQYDGYTFKVFHHNPQDSLSISNDNVTAVADDSAGNLWIGSSTGLQKYERATGKFYRLADSPRYTGTFLAEFITAILKDHEGNFWIGTLSEVGRFNPFTGEFEIFPLPSQWVPHIISFKPLHEDEEGNIWIGCNDGFLFYKHATKTFERVTVPWEKNLGYGMSAYQDRNGMLWLGTQSGLLSYDQKKNVWRLYKNVSENTTGVTGNTIRAICEDNYGRLWVGTQLGGLYVLHRESGTFERFIPTQSGQSNTRYEGVMQIYPDRSGMLWVGYDGAGLVKINPHPNKFPLVRFPLTGGTGTGDNFFKSVMVDRNGIIWAGTYDKGIKALDRITGTVKTFTHAFNNSRSVYTNTILALHEDRSGILWVGTRDGVDAFDRKAESFHHVATPWYEGEGNIILGMTTFCEDSLGVLWVGTVHGLMKFDSSRTSLSFIDMVDAADGSVLNTSVETIEQARDSSLWIGTGSRGLLKMIRDKGRVLRYVHDPSNKNSLSNDFVKTICTDPDGILWLGTREGLNRFDPVRNEWRRYYQHDGLPNDFIYGILMDQRRNLWISTNRGISRMNTDNLDHPQFRNYTPDDGLQSYEFNTGVYFRSGNGEMFFGGVNGLNTFFPDSIKDNSFLPKIAITGFKKFNQSYDFGRDVNQLSSIVLSYLDSEFSFEFAALEFTNPRLNQYAYTMEGFDNDWFYCGSQREARYTHLDPGEYTFRVKGSNNDGVWNEAGTSIKVVIMPPFWKTWWAYGLYVIAFALSAMGMRWLVANWKIIIASRKAQYVSHYKLLESIGEGGMGKVYRAIDMNTKQIVALKILNPALLKDSENRKRLMGEGRLLSSLLHPNIVKVFEVAETEEHCYIAMEYLSGGTLKQYLEKSFPLSRQELHRIIMQVCTGMVEIHSHGIIHRDMKTANIMLDEKGDIRIMDFGLSKSPLVTTMTTLGTVIGTLGYVAPEQVTGMNLDHRVDIFSFGVVLYELLTHQLPFRGENEIAVIHSIFNIIPPTPSHVREGIPPSLDSIVMRCLEKNPDHRFSSMKEIQIALTKEFR